MNIMENRENFNIFEKKRQKILEQFGFGFEKLTDCKKMRNPMQKKCKNPGEKT